jgi:hypothetical protein
MKRVKPMRPLAFRAAATLDTTQEQLGPLAEFIGNWKGKGFNLISLPDFQDNKFFRLKLNATFETLSFSPVSAPVPNRGSVEKDISFMAMQYQQAVNDIVTSESLHAETGMWLNLPPGTNDPSIPNPNKRPDWEDWKWSVARLGIIPHGDALLTQGPYKTNTAGLNGKGGGPFLPVLDSTPFTLDPKTGARINTTDPDILKLFTSPALPLPSGITVQNIANPNLVLADAIATQNIVETVVLAVNAAPVGDIALPGFIPSEPDINGGINNIPFVSKNANADSFAAIFWIETVKNKDGSKILQLQYSQTLILNFGGLNWPHISVATLIKG